MGLTPEGHKLRALQALWSQSPSAVAPVARGQSSEDGCWGEAVAVKEAKVGRGAQRTGHRDSGRSRQNISVASAAAFHKLAISVT